MRLCERRSKKARMSLLCIRSIRLIRYACCVAITLRQRHGSGCMCTILQIARSTEGRVCVRWHCLSGLVVICFTAVGRGWVSVCGLTSHSTHNRSFRAFVCLLQKPLQYTAMCMAAQLHILIAVLKLSLALGLTLCKWVSAFGPTH